MEYMSGTTRAGLINYIKQRIDNGEKPHHCGSNGGDGAHYSLTVGGGAWGEGEIYLSFTNHGYIDKPSDFNIVAESVKVRVY